MKKRDVLGWEQMKRDKEITLNFERKKRALIWSGENEKARCRQYGVR